MPDFANQIIDAETLRETLYNGNVVGFDSSDSENMTWAAHLIGDRAYARSFSHLCMEAENLQQEFTEQAKALLHTTYYSICSIA